MENIHILVVDDDKEIANLAAIYLQEEHYTVTTALSGVKALEHMKKEIFHLAILDIMMPGMDGFTLCRHIRETSNIPIIMLSARGNEEDKVEGLSAGADDYVVKPFGERELKARVKSQLRRYMVLNSKSAVTNDEAIIQKLQSNPPHLLQLHQLVMDTSTRTVTAYGKDAILTPTEFKILYFLASNAGKVYSTDEIFESVWKEKCYEANNTVMVHIRRIREKIELDPRNAQILKTVWGVGYKVEA